MIHLKNYADTGGAQRSAKDRIIAATKRSFLPLQVYCSFEGQVNRIRAEKANPHKADWPDWQGCPAIYYLPLIDKPAVS